MSILSPEQILKYIERWVTETGKLVIDIHDNPEAHFSLLIRFPSENNIQPLSIAFPKEDEKIVFSWNWIMEDIDSRAYHSIKDNTIKENLTNEFRKEVIKRSFQPVFIPNIYKLSQVAIIRLLPVMEFTKENFGEIIDEMVYMWALLMLLFKKYMNKSDFNLSEHI